MEIFGLRLNVRVSGLLFHSPTPVPLAVGLAYLLVNPRPIGARLIMDRNQVVWARRA